MIEPSLEARSSQQDPYALGAIIAGRYELRRVLGRGGAAVVYAAEHVLVRRPAALKIPLINSELRELLHGRLRRETEALAYVRHPAIVDVIDAGEVDGMPFLAMELLEGRTLTGLITARGKLEADDVVKIGVDLAEGMAAVHAAGVIHRDIKPANVLITRSAMNQIHLCDFGVARLNGPNSAFDERLTQAGALLGTPEYMPMEAFVCGPEADHRVDVFSLGITLFECLTGSVPVEGALGAILRQRSQAGLPPLAAARPDIPPALSQVVLNCIAADPGGRYASMAEVAKALRSCARTPLDSLDLLRAAAAPPQPKARQSQTLVSSDATARRSFARAPYVTLATLQRANGSTADARIEDLSEGGVLLVSRDNFKVGESLRLRFGMPISGRVFALAGTIRWCRVARGAPAMGFEFTDLPDAARSEIKQYVTLMSNSRTTGAR